jgi:hypothetical protein
MRLVVQQFGLQNPTWAGNAWPGQNLTAQVTAPGLTNDQRIEFVIQDGATNERLDSIVAAAGQNSVQWPVANLPSNANVTFRAILREKPSPANAQLAAITSVTSAAQALQSFGIQITLIDPAFVPGPAQEQLQVAFTITDANNRATQGRYEVWGERYPGATPEPVYKTNFNPAGAANWNTWNGMANQGYLNGKFITPEFSPYRVRIIIGTAAGDVDDPYGAGQGKVACAEAQFEIKLQTVGIKKWQNLQEATANAEYQLTKTLVVEPRNNDATGSYPVTAELPEDRPLAAPVVAQTGRLRIPVARHQLIKDALSQGSLAVGGAYLEKGDAPKWKLEEPFYSRPELPIQFEPKLASRNAGANPEGLFEATAIGPVVIEPVAEEFYNAALYPTPGAVASAHQNYWKNATFKIKRGKHNSPYHDGATNLPEFHYWQARFEVTGPEATSNETNLQVYDVVNFDNTLKYRFGQKELFVYLDRRLLSRSDAANNSEIDKNQFDYREVSNGANSTQIELRRKLIRAGQVLWIVRKDSTASGDNKVKNWEQFPPGPNCHTYFNGARGEEPTADLSNYFRAVFSKKGKKKPIIGKANAAFPFTKKYIDMKPDLAKQKEQERVETTAMLDGNERGRAGIIFSPSIIGGDAYVINAWIEREGYVRRFGFVEELPAVRSKSGRLTIWRWSRIRNSFRLPDIGTGGLAATVGGEAENAGRAYHGDGANMELQIGAIPANSTYGENKAFNEWTLTAPPAGGGGDPVHQHVVLATYRNAHNGATSSWEGHVPLNADTDIKNYAAVWDAYRWALPPGLPANLDTLIANTIHALPAGTSTHDAGVAVHNAIALRGLAGPDDAALVGGAAPIPDFWNNDPDKYYNEMNQRWREVRYKVVDALTPRDSSPEKINVIRWPLLLEKRSWKGYNTAGPAAVYSGTGGVCGFSRGDGQSMFATANVDNTLVRSAITNDNTFTHEMGHTMNLVHFRAGELGWKHHDVNYPRCIMSYDFCGGIILREGVANPVAVGATQETGWPDAVPSPLPDNYEGADANNADANKPCIHFPPLYPEGDEACAKCLLKVRGWKDDLLPFAWGHADLF